MIVIIHLQFIIYYFVYMQFSRETTIIRELIEIVYYTQIQIIFLVNRYKLHFRFNNLIINVSIYILNMYIYLYLDELSLQY